LIVEDEILIALDLEATMSGLGFEVCALAPSAREARALAMSNQPDVVVMDVYLDGCRDGIEAGRWLREVCEVPVVFVTSYSDKATVERIHEQVPGAPVLQKPVYRERLAEAISQVGAGLAGAHEFILELTEGYDTIVGFQQCPSSQ
jgi:DNA-binding NarL/FixJ family response regulator